jgi:hypothetical protein
MYHDSVRWTFGSYPDRFRDTRNKNFVRIAKVNGQIMFVSAREDDGQEVFVFMTQYEAEQMINYLRKLLDENN